MRARPARRFLLLISALALALAASGARAEAGAWRVGVALGYGSRRVATLGNRTYAHETVLYKLLANRPLAASRRLSLELQLEPFLGLSHHRLRNPWFVPPERRAKFTRGESYAEYGLDVGLVGRWAVTRHLSLFALAGVGPMYGEAATERLARGVAFSDVVAFGLGYRWSGVLLEVRPGFRHVSNADLQAPNAGHNALFVTLALSASR